MTYAAYFVLALAALAANLPFLIERRLLVWPVAGGKKSVTWRLFEMALLYLLLGGLAIWLEGRYSPVQPQNWQFYATTMALYIVFAYPGFIYRYFWRKPVV